MSSDITSATWAEALAAFDREMRLLIGFFPAWRFFSSPEGITAFRGRREVTAESARDLWCLLEAAEREP